MAHSFLLKYWNKLIRDSSHIKLIKVSPLIFAVGVTQITSVVPFVQVVIETPACVAMRMYVQCRRATSSTLLKTIFSCNWNFIDPTQLIFNSQANNFFFKVKFKIRRSKWNFTNPKYPFFKRKQIKFVVTEKSLVANIWSCWSPI